MRDGEHSKHCCSADQSGRRPWQSADRPDPYKYKLFGATATTTTASATARATTAADADATAATDITATDVATCSVCSQNIVDGEEDALFCEGTCKQWVHRYCAGVPLIQFQSLSASPSPFLCSFCRQSNYDDEIYVLRTAVKSLIKGVVELKLEIQKLRERHTVAEQPIVPASETVSWATVTGRRTKHGVQSIRGVGGGGRGGDVDGGGRGGGVGGGSEGNGVGGGGRGGGVGIGEVEGVVWVGEVEEVGLVEEIRCVVVSRDVELLERKWESISTHTGWRLEPTFCFEEDNATLIDPAQQPYH